ncbi:complexin-3-like [Hippoglossus hippoglossus]|uniref:complexin-3-like n=1 Tax=Hippoglossus hippoglossus TaxID=8267 RepID=UPI00148B94E8|nr:complexin-3-like [Hippoglossus hippoglossus]XP_035019227.1 complexin-3 [Hippoglossus stenolepis]XP_035019228.1 complexin-3 [Hippoglossus stenolepis]
MNSLSRVKKSLRTPIWKLTSCVSGVKHQKLCAKPRDGRGRGGGGGRRGCRRSGKTPPLRTAPPKDPTVICSYQADLEKERKQREAVNAQKNAERAALRNHFRRKYQLSKSPKDVSHLRSVGGKVSLPRGLSKIIYPETKAKDDGFNLLSAFQGLSFNTARLTGRKHSKASTPTPTTGDSCKVM